MIEKEDTVKPLLATCTATDIWKTAKELFGYPPTWKLSTQQIIELQRTIHRRQR